MVRTHAVVNEVLDDRAQLHRLKKELTVTFTTASIIFN
jgi:hypothetical protein